MHLELHGKRHMKMRTKVAIYDDVIGIYDEIWEGNELLYHNNNTRAMHWNIDAPNIGLVNHVHTFFS